MTREEAIKLLEDDDERPCTDECCAPFTCEECKFFQALSMALDALKEERPHGEWIPCKDDNFCKCSECKQIVMSEERSNYCSSCGAIMDGRR